MPEFELMFVVKAADDAVDRIYSNYDALVALHGNRTLLTVTVSGVDATAAARTIVSELEKTAHIRFFSSYLDLVNRREIANRARVSEQAVGLWVRGERSSEITFPEPFNDVAGGVWLWGDVNRWLDELGKNSDGLMHPTRIEHGIIDRWLHERISGVPYIWSSSWIAPTAGSPIRSGSLNVSTRRELARVRDWDASAGATVSRLGTGRKVVSG